MARSKGPTTQADRLYKVLTRTKKRAENLSVADPRPHLSTRFVDRAMQEVGVEPVSNFHRLIRKLVAQGRIGLDTTPGRGKGAIVNVG